MTLTTEGTQLLRKLCSVYRSRRKAGKSIQQAGAFRSAEHIQKTYLPDWHRSDVIAACKELKDHGYLEYIRLDCQPQEIQFTEKAVAYSQQTILRYLPKLLGWLWKVVELVLPVK